jgi:MFS family permease
MGLLLTNPVWSYSAFFVLTDPIVEELDILFEQQSWVITSYAVTFSAFLLFWGRVSDLYSAKPVFAWGFAALGVLNLIISFLPDKYSFFVIRALSGVAGAALIPAAFRLIVAVFEPHELGKAFTLYGMSGVLANVSGIIVAGFLSFDTATDQKAAWRFFFRLLAVMIIPAAVASFIYIPKTQGSIANIEGKWKRLDLVGAFSILAAIILLILGLTLGASYGWKTAGFLVPFLLSFALFPFFFFWEARIPEEYALLPPKTWRIPNFATLIIFALFIYGWWAVNFLPFIEIFVNIHGEKPIIAAVRMMPEGISAGAVTVTLTVFPVLVARPRWPITAGMVLSLVGYVLFSQSGSQIGADYWKFIFTGGVIGSGGMMAVFTGTNVAIMTSVPPEMAGVAGAVLQVALQVGSAVALSIQAGLLTVNPGSIANFQNVQASLYFQLGWGIVWLVGFLVFYRPAKKASPSAEADAENGETKVIVAH